MEGCVWEKTLLFVVMVLEMKLKLGLLKPLIQCCYFFVGRRFLDLIYL